jgi:cell division protein FtsX
MKKSLLPIALGALLLVSGCFNFIQYSNSQTLKEKLSLFESTFGTYEHISGLVKQQKEAENKTEHTITIYIKAGVSELQILNFKNLLEKQTAVTSVQYISASQALANFKSQHQSDPSVTQSLNELGSNPLPATLTVIISDPSQKASLLNFIKANDKNSIVGNIN